MKRVIIALAAATVLAAGAIAQDRGGFDRDGFGPRGMMGRFSPEDVEAFTDARIAALHAGLKLSADQEKLWPPVEQAIRDLVRLRREQARARRERREQGGFDRDRDDLPGLLRGMAERQGARAETLRKLADAAAPLYATFDDGQKRRLGVLVRHMRPGGMMRHGWREGGWRGGMGDRGFGERGFGRGDMDGRRP